MRTVLLAFVMLGALGVVACGPGGGGGGAAGGDEDAQVDEDLGSLKITNALDEPVAIYLDGQEIFTIPPARAYTFRNLPTGPATIYGVGRVSQRHHGLPELTIEKGGDYEWTIRP
jgi:hypothetical protein